MELIFIEGVGLSFDQYPNRLTYETLKTWIASGK